MDLRVGPHQYIYFTGIICLMTSVWSFEKNMPPINRTEFVPESSNIDETSDAFNLPGAGQPSTKTLPGYILWGPEVKPNEISDLQNSSTTSPSTADQSDFNVTSTDNTTKSASEFGGAMLLHGGNQFAPLESWTLTPDVTGHDTNSDTNPPATPNYESYSTRYPPSSPPQLTVDNLGMFHNVSADGAIAPMSLFQTDKQSNLLIGNRVVSFDAHGNVTGITSVDPDPAAGKVVAVDSHTLPSKEASFVAIAQESSDGFGSVASVYLVAAENTYTLFTRVQTNSSISAMKLYSDHDGNIMLAMAQRSFHCTAVFNSECGLSLIYKITGTGDAELSDAVRAGNATTVKVADITKSISLMYSACETLDNGTQSCSIINHFERPRMAPVNSFQEFSCDPSNAEFFNMQGFSYYLGPSPTCDKHQISLWDNQMDFMNTFNTFDQIPDSWFVVNAGYNYCDASLVIAGVGKEGTTYYSLTSPNANYTVLLHDPQMSVAQMWTAGNHIYCVNKSAESLSLFKMTCPDSYIAQIGKSELTTSTMPTVNGYAYEYSTPDTVSRSDSYDHYKPAPEAYSTTETTPYGPYPPNSVTYLPVVTEPTGYLAAGLPVETTPLYYAALIPTAGPSSTISSGTQQQESDRQSVSQYLTHVQPFDLLSKWSSLVTTKNGSLLVVPPTPDTPCYRSGVVDVTSGSPKHVSLVNVKQFCNPDSKNLSQKDLHHSKATIQYMSGNIYSVSLYKNAMELAMVIRDHAFFEVKRVPDRFEFTSVDVRICEGYPTVCAVVESMTKHSAKIRCYRMVKFRWIRMLNATVAVSSKLYIETYSRSERCMLLVHRPGHGNNPSELSMFRMKSASKGLQLISAGKIHSCSNKKPEIVNVQRTLWIAVAVPTDATDCSSSRSMFLEIHDNENDPTSRLNLDHLPAMAAASRNLQNCGGDVLIIQNNNGSPQEISGRHTTIFTIPRKKQDIALLSYSDFPVGSFTSLQFFTVAKGSFLLMRHDSYAVISEINCTKNVPEL